MTLYFIVAVLFCLAVPPLRALGLLLLAVLGYFNPWACGVVVGLILLYIILTSP